MAENIYTAHRENQREWILEVAESLFVEKGIEQVTVGEIARNAHLTRATIYKYFANKDEIGHEIFKVITRGWQHRNEREVWGYQGNGYQRLEKFLTTFFEYLVQNPMEARLIAELNYLYARYLPAELVKGIMTENLSGDWQFVLSSIQDGITDGSLRSNLDPELTMVAFFNFLSSIMTRFGAMGDKVEEEYGFESQIIFELIYRIFLDGLKQPS